MYCVEQLVRTELENTQRDADELKKQKADISANLEVAVIDLAEERDRRSAAEQALAASTVKATRFEAEARSLGAKAQGDS